MTTPRDVNTRDGRLDAAWRAASREEPPFAADDAVRAAARRAVASAPQMSAALPQPRAPRQRAWWPLAAAATVAAITLGIMQFAPPENAWNAQPIGAPLGPSVETPIANQPGSLASEASKTEAVGRLIPSDRTPVDKPVLNAESSQNARAGRALLRRQDITADQTSKAAASVPRSTRETDAAARTEPHAQPAPVATPEPAPAPSMTARKAPLANQASTMFAAPPPLALAQQGAALRKEQAADAFATPSPEELAQKGAPPRDQTANAFATRPPEGLAQKAAPRDQGGDAFATPPPAIPEQTGAARRATNGAVNAGTFPAPAALPTPRALPATPAVPAFDAWVSAVRQLLRDGQSDAARREMMRLADAYPDRVQGLPAELRALLPTPQR